MGPLLYLTLSSLRNRVRVRLKRLKQPRYLIGMIVGLAYFWMVFGMPRASRQRAFAPTATSAPSGIRSPFELGGAAFLFVLCASAWIPSGRRRPALNFTQSDVQFLFPAPFTRRELIRYKLLRSQTGVLIGSAFMTFLFRPWTLASGMFFVGMALFMTILNLHLTGISLSRESLGTHGMSGLARQWLPLALAVGATIVLVVTVVLDWPTLSSLQSAGLLAELWRLATTGASGIVMWPFRAVVRVPAAETPAAFLGALPWALLILALNYVWVIRSDARFEEASAELAEKIARIRKGQRPSAPKPRSATQTPFRLSLEGRPEMAIFWKNLILLGRYASLRTLLRFVPLFLIVATFARVQGAGGAGAALAGLCAIVFVITLLLGPQLARNDLRQDLANLALIKTWPVNGATLVRGEVMAPAALLTAIAWFSAIGGLVFARGTRIEPSVIVAALVVAPGIILLQLLAQNAIAVMWPSWVVTNTTRVRGIDVMGQRMIMMFGLLLVLVVAVVPAALVAALTGLALSVVTGRIFVIVPALAAALVLFAEAFLASHLIGKMLDRTDVSAIDAVE
jgi:ABC-2 type transport system permease protein